MERFHMNSDVRDLFRELEPPHGGAERFAARLDAETRASRPVLPRRALAAAAACVAVALVVTLVWLRRPSDPEIAAGAEPAVDIYNAPELDRLLGRPLRTTELTVMLGEETLPVTQLATANQKIRIYQIDEPAPAPTP